MNDLLNEIVALLTTISALLPLEAWVGIIAALVFLLMGIRIRRRRQRPAPLPEAPQQRTTKVKEAQEEAPGAAFKEDTDQQIEGDRDVSPPTPAEPEPLEPAPVVPAESLKPKGAIATDAEIGEAPVEEPPPPPIPKVDPKPVVAEVASAPPTRAGLLRRLKNGLSKTRRTLNAQIDDLFSGRSRLDDDLVEELEELLIGADVGVQTALALSAKIESQGERITSPKALKETLRRELRALIPEPPPETLPSNNPPHVVMVVGVNGVGKTTTIGKLAHRYVQSDRKVLIAAADTFRAAAVEQLEIWSQRAGAELIKHKEGSDPAAVAFDGVQAAVSRQADVLIIDTAGRLHTKVNLMEELKKIRRSVNKNLPTAPHEVLLVLDATTGQNALSQAKLFHEAMGVTGIALTKLDGTAKGGIAITICDTLKLPLQYIGVGEQMHDLQIFDPDTFIEALF